MVIDANPKNGNTSTTCDVEVANGSHCATPAIGQDLGRMLQQMMPMMYQIIGGGVWFILVVAASSWFQAKVELQKTHFKQKIGKSF